MQGHLEKLLSGFFKEAICLQSSGRTDAGVHAFNQVLHFELPKKITFSSFKEAQKHPNFITLSSLLKAVKKHCPYNIEIKNAFLVKGDFHALRSTINKTYVYFISPVTSAFNALQICKVRAKDFEHLKSNIKLLNQLASLLVGEKDFKSFQNTGTIVKTTVREIFKASWCLHKQTDFNLGPISALGAPKDYLEFKVTANGFLKQMVRNIVGCQLHLMQKSEQAKKDLISIIAAKNTQKYFALAPPEGLYLQDINYPQNLDRLDLKI